MKAILVAVLWTGGSVVLILRGLLHLRAIRQDRREMPDAYLVQPLTEAVGSIVFGGLGLAVAIGFAVWMVTRIRPAP